MTDKQSNELEPTNFNNHELTKNMQERKLKVKESEEKIKSPKYQNDKVKTFLKKKKKCLAHVSGEKNEETYQKLLRLYQDIIKEEIKQTSKSHQLPDIIECSCSSESSDTLDESYMEDDKKYQVFFSNVTQAFKFEFNYYLPSTLGLILFCIAHISVFEITTSIISESLKRREAYTNQVYLVLILLGFFLSRISGVSWYFLDDKGYESAKYYLRQGRVSALDLKLQQWFKQHSFLRSSIDLFCFYIVYVGTAHFVCNVLLPLTFDNRESFMDDLPSQYENITTSVYDELAKDPESANFTTCTYAAEDFAFIFNETAAITYNRMFGSYKAAIVSMEQSLVFYIMLAAASLSALQWTGVSIFE